MSAAVGDEVRFEVEGTVVKVERSGWLIVDDGDGTVPVHPDHATVVSRAPSPEHMIIEHGYATDYGSLKEPGRLRKEHDRLHADPTARYLLDHHGHE